MSYDYHIKEGDSLPDLEAQIRTPDYKIADLTNAQSVQFRMLHVESDTLVVASDATIANATAGKVSYDLSAGETNGSGIHLAEWRVTTSSGDVYSYPNDENQVVFIEEGVGRGDAPTQGSFGTYSVESLDAQSVETNQENIDGGPLKIKDPDTGDTRLQIRVEDTATLEGEKQVVFEKGDSSSVTVFPKLTPNCHLSVDFGDSATEFIKINPDQRKIAIENDVQDGYLSYETENGGGHRFSTTGSGDGNNIRRLWITDNADGTSKVLFQELEAMRFEGKTIDMHERNGIEQHTRFEGDRANNRAFIRMNENSHIIEKSGSFVRTINDGQTLYGHTLNMNGDGIRHANGVGYTQRGAPTTSDLNAGERMIYVSDGSDAHTAGDLVSARNQGGTIIDQVIADGANDT